MSEVKKRGGARIGAGRHIKGERPRVTTTLMMEEALKEKVQAESKRRGITFSDLVDIALRKELGE